MGGGPEDKEVQGGSCSGKEEGHGGGCPEEEMVQGSWLRGEEGQGRRWPSRGSPRQEMSKGRLPRGGGPGKQEHERWLRGRYPWKEVLQERELGEGRPGREEVIREDDQGGTWLPRGGGSGREGRGRCPGKEFLWGWWEGEGPGDIVWGRR